MLCNGNCALEKMDQSEKKPFSFGFTKKKEKQTVIEQTTIGEKSIVNKEEPDFVLEVAGKEVKRFVYALLYLPNERLHNFAPSAYVAMIAL